MKMKKVIFMFFLYTIICTGCQSQNIDSNQKKEIESKIKPYLSITESYYADETEETMLSRVIYYDVNSKKVKEINSVPYTSQYPLTLYESGSKEIYYTAYSGRGDQIYNYTKDSQLTNNLCAINYLSKCGDKKFVIGTFLECSGLEPLIYDSNIKKYKQLVEDPKDDLQAWATAIDYKNQLIYFSTYSDKEDRKLMDTNKAPVSTIYGYNLIDGSIEKVYSTDLYIVGMAIKNHTLYLTTAKYAVADKEEYQTIAVDIVTNRTSSFEIDGVIVGNMEIIDNKMYFLGFVKDKRGIYSMDLSTHKISTVLHQNDKEFINSFTLNY